MGRTALYWAAVCNNVSVVRRLVCAGWSFTVRHPEYGYTVLHILAPYNTSVDLHFMVSTHIMYSTL